MKKSPGFTIRSREAEDDEEKNIKTQIITESSLFIDLKTCLERGSLKVLFQH